VLTEKEVDVSALVKGKKRGQNAQTQEEYRPSLTAGGRKKEGPQVPRLPCRGGGKRGKNGSSGNLRAFV